jgi:hypothetical protein
MASKNNGYNNYNKNVTKLTNNTKRAEGFVWGSIYILWQFA